MHFLSNNSLYSYKTQKEIKLEKEIENTFAGTLPKKKFSRSEDTNYM
jgi:hypothetical protein